MIIALAQLNYHIGHFEQNTRKICDAIESAKTQKADLVVFAELAVCGYPPRDFLEFADFIKQCEQSLTTIASHCIGISAIIGAPSINSNSKGKPLFNSAYLLSNGTIKQIHHKTLLPTYDIFDEYRYFEPNREFITATINNTKLAITICEDIWNIDEQPMYIVNPLDQIQHEQPELIINISASPFHYDQELQRKEIIKRNVERYQIPLIYVNHTGAQTELIFDGGSLAMNADGHILTELSYFSEDLQFVEFDTKTKKLNAISSNSHTNNHTKISKIHDALVTGIRDYFKKLNFSSALIGLSGGIDSAVTAVLAAEALGNKNVKGILMPSEFSSDHSISDAEQLAKNLSIAYEIIPIKHSYDSFLETLSAQFKGMPFNLAEENLQARIRGVLLMAMTNKFGYILLNTSNKSEAAVGYGTLYGDMCGGLSVLGDLYKTEVYELAAYINRNKVIIPINSIIKPPSAELRPDQKDSDSLPEYDILDKILYQYIELRKGPQELIQMGFDEALVRKTLKLVNTNEYKRHQTPPILRISPKAFGTGRRMPIVGKYLS